MREIPEVNVNPNLAFVAGRTPNVTRGDAAVAREDWKKEPKGSDLYHVCDTITANDRSISGGFIGARKFKDARWKGLIDGERYHLQGGKHLFLVFERSEERRVGKE